MFKKHAAVLTTRDLSGKDAKQIKRDVQVGVVDRICSWTAVILFERVLLSAKHHGKVVGVEGCSDTGIYSSA